MSKEAMKLALEALQECRRDPRLKYEHPTYDKAIKALEEALAKQEQGEPVATVSRNQDESLTFTPLYDFYVTNGMELYEAPQQRKPLTDEERAAIAAQHKFPPMSDSYQYWLFKGVDAAEAAHGIKEKNT